MYRDVSRISNPNAKPANSRKGRLFTGLALGIGIRGLHLGFFLFGLGLGCTMVCDVALVCVDEESTREGHIHTWCDKRFESVNMVPREPLRKIMILHVILYI